MRRMLLPVAVFIVFLLVCSNSKASLDEEMTQILEELTPTPEKIPAPSKFIVGDTLQLSRYVKVEASGERYRAYFDGVTYTPNYYGYEIWGETPDGKEYVATVQHKVGMEVLIYVEKGWDANESSLLYVGRNDTVVEKDDEHVIYFTVIEDRTVPPSQYDEVIQRTRVVKAVGKYIVSCGDYTIFARAEMELVAYLSKNYVHDAEISYPEDPDSYFLSIDEMSSFGVTEIKEYLSNAVNTVVSVLQKYVGEENEEEEEHATGNITIYFEHYFDITDGEPMITYWWKPIVECGSKKYYPYYNMTVEHLATGTKRYVHAVDFDQGKVSIDKVFNVSLISSTGDGRFRITLDILIDDSSYINRFNDSSFLPNKAIIECNVETNGNKISSVKITKARNCWIKIGNEWEILWSKGGYKEKEATNGFDIMVRSNLAWEKRIKYSIYEFLKESNFYSSVEDAYKFDLATIDSIPIYYERGSTPGYNPSLNVINLSNAAGNIYTYDSDEFDAIFHEFAHALKENAYHFADEDVDAYLGGEHGNTCSETNIYFAFEEAHSEFFASLMLDYVKEKGFIEDEYLAETNYYSDACHFGKEGDMVEGAIAGLLLNGLYRDYTKYEYDSPQTKAYEIFAKACELCNKYLKHYPYSIHDLLPFIFAVEPRCGDELGYADLLWNGGYGCKTWKHGNLYAGEPNGLYGYPLLIAVEPSWLTKVTAYVNGTSYFAQELAEGAWDVADGGACVIFIDKDTRIEADFSEGDGVYIVLFDLDGNEMEEILAMEYGLLGNAIIEFDKDGIKVVQGKVVVKSNAGVTYKAGDKIKITPHSEFVLKVENETALLYVINGSVGVDNGIEYKEVEKGMKAVTNEESIDLSKYKDKEIEELWDNFGDAMETIGLEKEGNGGKQPAFELFVTVVAIAIIIAIRKRK